MRYVIGWALLTLVMWAFMSLMLMAWDKEYEIERERIAEYKASLEAKR
ncbi:hypothetical protein LU290_03280 [Moraxella nasibovis]|nr:hypothetical protein [Moraxella nasibovis]WFF39258.1 hypothetical protein LU290_03280 [Moraxella nasibovis]